MKNITLTTDFGIADSFVGSVKGVIYGISPEVKITDITHLIPRHDIKSAMFVIYSTYSYFPEGTIHAIIVDPGVGSDRKIICVETPKYTFLAPDNGVLSWVLLNESEYNTYQITDSQLFLPEVSSSFHGRDIFAPIAGRLSLGETPAGMGVKYNDPKIEDFPEVQYLDNQYFEATIIYIDNFGNVITNLENQYFDQVSEIYRSSGEILKIVPGDCYADVPSGQAVFFPGSCGFVEIAINLDSAKDRFSFSNREILLFKRKD